jgi:hypothetical protein
MAREDAAKSIPTKRLKRQKETKEKFGFSILN